MKDWKKLLIGIVWIVTACLCASPLSAQQEGGEKPKPAARELLPLLDTGDYQQDTDQETQTIQPDNRPVGGVQNMTLGTPQMRHSYWVPGIRYSNAAGSNNSNLAAASTQWNTTSFVSGDVSLLEAWSHSLLSANYSGGGFTSTDSTQGNGQYHQLSATYEILQRRWQGQFFEQFSFLPQSSFGFGGTSGLASPGITGSLGAPLPGLQSTLVPGQTILTAAGLRYSATSGVQLIYEVSARGLLTIGGVHGLLRFINSGNFGNDTETLNVGYNYAITRKDTVGLVYRFSAYHYPGNPQALGDHVAQFVYGRRITGRLGLTLAGGPDVTTFRVPIATSTRRVSGTTTAALIYAFPRSSVTLNYTHGISSGSGVFSGASTNLLGATWSRQLTRVYNGSLNFQYAKNGQITSAVGRASPSYNTWLVGAGLSRPLGRSADFSFGYQAQIQGANSAVCIGANCSANHTAHQVFLSFQWHARPLVLR